MTGDSRQTEQEVGRGGGCWGLLAMMTCNKTRMLARWVGIRSEGPSVAD